MGNILGLDIGISSVGWAIIDSDTGEIIDKGVRLFTEASKEDNKKRRDFRSGRRLKSRRVNRRNELVELLTNNGLYEKTMDKCNPYVVRAKGLYEKLNNKELTAALLNICKHRGSSLEVVEDKEIKKEGTKKVLSENDALIREGKYVCEIQLDRFKEKGKIRGTSNNFRSKDYEKELNKLLTTQGIDENLKKQIITIIMRRRNFSDGPGSFKSQTKYGRVYDENGNVTMNMIQKMTGKCSIYENEYRAPAMSPSAEFFNLLNDINNLSINGEKIEIDDKQRIIKYAFEKGKISPSDVAKLLHENKNDIQGFRLELKKNTTSPILTELKGFKTIKEIYDRNGISNQLKDFKTLDKIAKILTDSKVIEERLKKLKELFNDDKLISELANLTDFKQYHSLSLKAIYELNEEMYTTQLNHMQILSVSQRFEFRRSKISQKGNKKIALKKDAILSPVALRAYRQAIKVVNAAREEHGEFELIVVETTRDKNSQEQKNRIKNEQALNRERNKYVNDILLDYENKHHDNINKTKKLSDKIPRLTLSR